MKNNLLIKLSKYFDKDILESMKLENVNGKKDIISSIYENIHDKDKRKKFAQFFTHKELVKYILNQIPLKQGDTVLDPACGAGAFIIEAIDRVGINSVYGIDIDEKAIGLCDLNIEYTKQTKSQNIIQSNTLKNPLKKLFPNIEKSGGFDVIVGNPPFQNLLKNIDYNPDDSVYNQVLSGIANSATLMIAKSYEFLKPGGFLGFVLPKNIFRVDSFSQLRRFILNNFKIKNIYDLDHYFKDVRGDQIIFILQKKMAIDENLFNTNVIINIYKKDNVFENPYSYSIQQKVFLKYNFFPVFYDKRIFILADKLLNISNNIDKESNGQIFRGVGLSTSSENILQSPMPGAIKLFRGDSIKRFGIKYPLFLNSKYSKYLSSNKISKLLNEKIILQNLCSKEGGIYATLSDRNELTLDTVTNIFPKANNIKYLLGLINSRLANFFLIFVIFLDSNFTMHTDRQYIGKIPVIAPTGGQEFQINMVVDLLLSIEDKYSKEFKTQYNKLNKLIYKVFNINDSEVDIIESLLNEVMSKKHYGTTNE